MTTHGTLAAPLSTYLGRKRSAVAYSSIHNVHVPLHKYEHVQLQAHVTCLNQSRDNMSHLNTTRTAAYSCQMEFTDLDTNCETD